MRTMVHSRCWKVVEVKEEEEKKALLFSLFLCMTVFGISRKPK